MDLAALRNRSAQVRVEFDNEILNFTYNPHAYDDECQRSVHRLSDAEDNSGLAGMFERLITSWDLVDNGQPVTCSYDGFVSLMPFLRSKILNSLIEDEMERGKLNRSASSSNQPAPRRSGLVPIGTQNSTTSNGQESQTTATT